MPVFSRAQRVVRYRGKQEVTMPSAYARRSAAATALRREKRLETLRVRAPMYPKMEVKFFDVSKTGFALTSPTDATGGEMDPATILCLNGVPQGDTASSRDGFKIAMKSLYINGLVRCVNQATQSAADIVPMVYLALVLDTQTNGGTATGLDSENVFANPSTDSILAASPLRNMSFTERYKVLKVFKCTLPTPAIANDTGATGGLVQNGFAVPFEMAVDLKGLQTKFQSATTTGYVGTIVDNSLHLVGFCNSTSLAPTVYYQSRLRFVG